MEATYQVRLDVFEGPLDLLCHLVEKNEIDIWDIPIAKITEQYLEYLDAMRELNIEVAAEFLVMAARLLHIKAKMLLPETREEGAEEEEEDPRLDLAAALLEYKTFKDAAEVLGARAEGRWALVGRPEVYAPQGVKPVYEDPAGGVTTLDLAKAFLKVLKSFKEPSNIPVPRDKVRVVDKLYALRRLFTRRRRVLFNELLSRQASRPEVVATFLALLELIRRGCLAARQDRVFGPITIERRREVQEWDSPAEEAFDAV